MANKKPTLEDFTLIDSYENLKALDLTLDEAEDFVSHMNKIRIEVQRVWSERYKLPKSRIQKYIDELPTPKETIYEVKGLKLPTVEAIQYFTPDKIELLDSWWRQSLRKIESVRDVLRREVYVKQYKKQQEERQGIIITEEVL